MIHYANMNHIFLYGPPGSGKSVVGRVLARNLGLDFVDIEIEIEEFIGASIGQVLSDWGESGLRDIESAALRRVTRGPARVIALTATALLRSQDRARAENRGSVVLLTADMEILLERIQPEPEKHPLVSGDRGAAKLSLLLEKRAAHYRTFEMRVATDGLLVEDVAWYIQVLLGRFHVRGMGQPYDVFVQSGGFENLGEMLRQYGMRSPVAIVSDENVAPLYADRVVAVLRKAGLPSALITLPPGESTKSLATIGFLWSSFLGMGLDRQSTVLALGGGVISDVAGFAAGTYLRGIPWVVLPSSLLGMVDASLGGTNGIDLAEGKNLVGTYHPPRLVFANPYMLSTLKEAELRAGLAEAVKHGIIADPALFSLCSNGLDAVKSNLMEIVQRAMSVKVQVVEADPFEKNIRAALDFGHVVGHAIEKTSNYQIRHGEAISIGMVVEARLAERLWLCGKGLANKIEDTLHGLGLPTEIPANLSRHALVNAMRMGKKRDVSSIQFALPEDIGQMQIGIKVKNLNEVLQGSLT
jgi:shikimate kinase / 3-dehydroquinate synthase